MILIVKMTLSALFCRLEKLVTVLAPTAKVAVLPAFCSVNRFRIVNQSVLAGMMHNIFAHRKNTRHQASCIEINLAGFITDRVVSITGVVRTADVIATLAGQPVTAIPLVAVAMLAVLGLGKAVQQLRFSIHKVIGLDIEFIAGCRKCQINCIVIPIYLCKVELRIICDSVGFLTKRTADKVGDALLVVHRAVVERLCPGVGMVMAGQDHIDPSLLSRRIDLLLGILAHASHRIGVVDRLVHNQDLPGCV